MGFPAWHGIYLLDLDMAGNQTSCTRHALQNTRKAVMFASRDLKKLRVVQFHTIPLDSYSTQYICTYVQTCTVYIQYIIFFPQPMSICGLEAFKRISFQKNKCHLRSR